MGPATQIQGQRQGCCHFSLAQVFLSLALSTGYIMCRPHCKMRAWFPEIKNFEIATLRGPFVEPGLTGGREP